MNAFDLFEIMQSIDPRGIYHESVFDDLGDEIRFNRFTKTLHYNGFNVVVPVRSVQEFATDLHEAEHVLPKQQRWRGIVGYEIVEVLAVLFWGYKPPAAQAPSTVPFGTMEQRYNAALEEFQTRLEIARQTILPKVCY